MRNPNGYGTIKKLSGKRRKPFGVFITTGFKQAEIADLTPLKAILSPDLYAQVEKEVKEYEKLPKYHQEQKAIGYYATRQEALIALAEYNKKPYDLEGLTFAQCYQIVYDKHIKKKSSATRYSYKASYDRCTPLYDMRLRDIRTSHLQGIIDQCAGMSKSTQTNLISLFHLVFDYATSNDLIDKDYSRYVKVVETGDKRDKTPFTHDEIRKMWDDPEYFAPVLILIYTGLRVGEYLALKDIDIKNRLIRVHGTKTASAERIVPIHKDIIGLFDHDIGLGYSYAYFCRKYFEPRMERLGLKRTPHECRHTFATIAKESGLDPYYVKRILGHLMHDITDDVYTHTYEEKLIEQIDKFKAY